MLGSTFEFDLHYNRDKFISAEMESELWKSSHVSLGRIPWICSNTSFHAVALKVVHNNGFTKNFAYVCIIIFSWDFIEFFIPYT